MLTVPTIHDLNAHVGAELGPSDWLLVTQYLIDAFAELTQDRHWIHIDVRRAEAELPEGRTIAHGLLTLSLMPRLADTLLKVEDYRRGLNYGCNRIRFTAPVQAGASIRLRQRIQSVDDIEGGIRLTLDNVIEVQGNEKPAMYAETVLLMYE